MKKKLINKNVLFNTWRELDAQKLIIRSQWVLLGGLFLLLTLVLLGWNNAQKTQRVYFPPSLQSGGFTHINKVPKSTVYAFAFQIFSAVNSWPDGGIKDYDNNIHAYHNYFSESMLSDFQSDFKLRQREGALSRKRMVSAVVGMGYNPSKIIYEGNGVWKINLKLNVVETVGGTVVKHVIMDYPLRIERVDTSIQVNPWGLVLAGYTQAPYRIKTLM